MISDNSPPAAQAAFSRLLRGVVDGGHPALRAAMVPIANDSDTPPVITLNPSEAQLGKHLGKSGLRLKFSSSQFSMHAPIYLAPRGAEQTIYTMLVKRKDVPFGLTAPITGGEYEVIAWDKGYCSVRNVLERLFSFMPECSASLIGILNVLHGEFPGAARDLVSGVIRTGFLASELEAQGFRVMHTNATQGGVVVTIGWIPEQMRHDHSVVYGVGRFLFVNGQFFRWITGPGHGDNSIVCRVLRRVLSKVAQPLSEEGQQFVANFEEWNGKVMGANALIKYRFEQFVLGSTLFADGQDADLAALANHFYPTRNVAAVETLISNLRYEIGRQIRD